MPLLVPFSRPIVHASFLRRWKRFFVDVEVDGRIEIAHTANTGSMRGLLVPGAPVLLTRHDGTKRKLPLELEAIAVPAETVVETDVLIDHVKGADGVGPDGRGLAAWVSVNTGAANSFAAAAIANGLIDELRGYTRIQREVMPSPRARSRLDLRLEADATPTGARLPPCFVEVKSVTLREGRRALFPDAPTARGVRHLDVLARLARRGARAVMLYVARRDDCEAFAPAASIDPSYARAHARARAAGVEMVCAVARVDARGLSWGGRLPVEGVA